MKKLILSLIIVTISFTMQGCYRATMNNIATGFATYDTVSPSEHDSIVTRTTSTLCNAGDVVVSTISRLWSKTTLVIQATCPVNHN